MHTRDPWCGGAQGVVGRRVWSAGTTCGGVGHLGLTNTETWGGRWWTSAERRCAGSEKPSNNPRSNLHNPGTLTTGHHERTNGTRRNQHNPGTPAAQAAAADKTQQPDTAYEGKNG